MSVKRPPELTWQDKAILVAIPLVVFTIFMLANYLSQGLTVADAFEQKLRCRCARQGQYNAGLPCSCHRYRKLQESKPATEKLILTLFTRFKPLKPLGLNWATLCSFRSVQYDAKGERSRPHIKLKPGV